MNIAAELFAQETKKITIPDFEQIGEITIRKLKGTDFWETDYLPLLFPLPEDRTKPGVLPPATIEENRVKNLHTSIAFSKMILTKCIVDAPFKVMLTPAKNCHPNDGELAFEIIPDAMIVFIVQSVKEFSGMTGESKSETSI